MSVSRKYGRTYHYGFSLGTTSDDRINHEWEVDIKKLKQVIDLEKMDGENQCLNEFGIFARSHAAPTRNPWSEFLKEKHAMIQNDLKENDLEIFGENLYAIHSIIYPKLDEHFKVFAIRCKDKWLGWEEVKWYCDIFDFRTVPEIRIYNPNDFTAKEIEKFVLTNSNEPSFYGSLDLSGVECTKEGIVTRNFEEFDVNNFKENVFKNVRKNHVATDEHWVRNWKRAPLIHEQKIKKDGEEGNKTEIQG